MAKPKLALIPAAQGTKFYSVLPSDGVGDFTFTRGSVATRINAQGLIENVASGQSRLDYPMIDGVQKGCPHHILEPVRTNNITYSQDLNHSSWNPSGLTVSSGGISPDGTLNSQTITSTAASGIIQKAVSLTGLRVLSIFAKKGTHKYLYMGGYGGTSTYANFDLENGFVSNGANAEIENYGNGWYRCTCLGIDGTTGGVQIFPSNRPIGDATTNGSIEVFGVQLESGSYPTSYIPTTTTTVTRSAETANGAGNASTFNDSEGVLMAEISDFNNDSFRQLTISSGSNSNAISIMNTTTENQVVCFVNNGGVTQASISTILNSTHEFNKIAIKYKLNDFSVYINGFEIGVDTNGTLPTGLNTLNFDNGSGSGNVYGNTKQIQYFDSILADTQLEQLTSWQSFRDMANGQLYTIE